MRNYLAVLFLVAAPILSGCGFTPIYAAGDVGRRPLLSHMTLSSVNGIEAVSDTVKSAFDPLVARTREDALYDLALDVTETAVPLAVQIDDSVTRYNYRLAAKYTLLRRSDNKQTSGGVEAVASFNVVASQYSTVFAERRAREKAATALALQIERDVLLKLSADERAELDARRANGAL